MVYRKATAADSKQVAMLHARSWQEHYRGILREEYLNQQVLADRLKVWTERLSHPSDNQFVLVAEDKGLICGLACVYLNHDPVFGSLLDNLHVLSTYKGQGMGKVLLQKAASWAYERAPAKPLYLWVYAKNVSAREFYDRMGGVHEETTEVENPGGGHGEVYRYVWRDIPALLGRQ